MDKIVIIGVPQSNYLRTVRIAAREMGIDYDLDPAPPHSPPVTAIHPLGKVPVMRHGPVALCESRAIIAYLERTFDGPNLSPQDPRAAAEVEQWASMLTTAMIPHFVGEYLFAYLFPGTADGTPGRARVDAVRPRLEKYLAILEGEAARTGYIGADRFSLADAYLLPVLHYLKDLPESGAILSASEALSAYMARHEKRPSVAATVPPGIGEAERARGERILAEANG